MPERQAQAEWNGSLQEGSGSMRLGSGAFEGAYSFKSRFEEGTGTNPEELIAAAHAGCFSMALAAALGRGGYEPRRVQTTAKVHLTRGDEGFSISRIDLMTTADVPGIAADAFQEVADTAKRTCPVSKALAGTEITLDAKLES
ncbi:MAG: OsmC family protein [Actinobacteria bacterium]|nr:MAG: OsmC family protein [Actinomycetota bacterium]